MSLQRWSRVAQSQCRSCGRSSSFLRPSLFDTSLTTTLSAPSNMRHYAKRSPPSTSPAAKIKARKYGRQPVNKTYKQFVEECAILKAKFEKDYKWLYEDGRRHGAFDPKLGLGKFREIGRRTLHDAENSPLTAQVVNSICPGDPDTVFDVGNAIFRSNQWAASFGAWVYKVTPQAGAVIPLAYCILSQMRETGGGKLRSVESEQMIEIARERRHPLALRMWAELLWQSGHPNEALKILNELVKNTYPSNTPGNQRDDILLDGFLKPPWQLVAEIYNSQGKFAKADEMMKLGALAYRDPSALVAYAYLRKEAEDWEAYEQCLVVAAGANYGEACFRLANYYYNIYKGEIPSRDEMNYKKNWFAAPIYKLFGQSRTQKYYRAMAMEWYFLAVMHNHIFAIRNLAILLREQGDSEVAYAMLTRLKELKPELWDSSNILKLRNQFSDTTFQPELPPSWIAL
jgi:tetratricopeptide (TPR) repeat protein